MVQVIGIRFRRGGRIYTFKAPEAAAVGDAVVVETERGQEMGTVAIPSHEMEDKESLRTVLRQATPEDREAVGRRCQQAREALENARGQGASRGLPIKLLAAEYNLDGSRLTFYFS
ncbi:MAG: PSP1 domain-containing protein, partial [Chloroflexota bacterium]